MAIPVDTYDIIASYVSNMFTLFALMRTCVDFRAAVLAVMPRYDAEEVHSREIIRSRANKDTCISILTRVMPYGNVIVGIKPTFTAAAPRGCVAHHISLLAFVEAIKAAPYGYYKLLAFYYPLANKSPALIKHFVSEFDLPCYLLQFDVVDKMIAEYRLAAAIVKLPNINMDIRKKIKYHIVDISKLAQEQKRTLRKIARVHYPQLNSSIAALIA